VLLTRDEAYGIRTLVTIAPITTRIRGIPAEVQLGRQDGLLQPSVVNLDTIQTIATQRLLERISSLGPQRMQELDAAIHFALGLES
jgi:mRNA interferase MazF